MTDEEIVELMIKTYSDVSLHGRMTQLFNVLKPIFYGECAKIIEEKKNKYERLHNKNCMKDRDDYAHFGSCMIAAEELESLIFEKGKVGYGSR